MFLVFGILMFAVVLMSNGDAPKPSAAAELKESKLNHLLKDKVEVLQQVVTFCENGVKTGEIEYKQLYDAQRPLGRAQLELCSTDEERIVVLEKCLVEAKKCESILEERVQVQEMGKIDVLRAHADYLDIEIELERLKSK